MKKLTGPCHEGCVGQGGVGPAVAPRVSCQDICFEKDFENREKKLGGAKDNIEHENGEE